MVNSLRLFIGARVAIALLVLGLLTVVRAAAIDWTGSLSDDWNTSGNWSLNRPPNAGDYVYIDLDSVLLNGAPAGAADRLYLGITGQASLTISNGASFTNTLTYLGATWTGEGNVVVTGNNSTWTAGSIYFGKYDSGFTTGHGSLLVSDGGHVNASNAYMGFYSNANSDATISGANAQWTVSNEFYVGYTQAASVHVEAGGALSTANAFVGYTPGSHGHVTVTGTDSTWTDSGTLKVGSQIQSTLDILDNAHVTSNVGSVGYYLGDKGSATVDHATWTSTTALNVGHGGTGTLMIQNGGDVSSVDAYIGRGSIAHGTLTVTGSDSSWTSTNIAYVGYTGTGTVNVQNGADAYLKSVIVAQGGDNDDATGTVNVTGEGSLMQLTGWLYVGGWPDITNNSTGEVNVSNGAILNDNSAYIGFGSTGSVNVSGQNTQWNTTYDIGVGYNCQAAIEVTGGAAVDIGYGATFGYGESGRGDLLVSGAGSTFHSSSIIIARDTAGTATVSAGGMLSAASVMIGESAALDNSTRSNGSLTVTGPGSSLVATGFVNIATFGDATARIENGATATTTNTYLGYGVGGVGTLTVTGANSAWNSTNMYVGGSITQAKGLGTVHIQDNAAVNLTGTLKIWNQGTVNLAGGTLSANTIDKTISGSFNFTGGNLHVNTFTGNLTNAGGTLRPGNSIGHTDIVGNYTQNANAAMTFEIASLSSFDTLSITGSALLNGLLNLQLINGYNPTGQTSYDLITATSISAAGLSLAGLDGASYQIVASGGSQILRLLLNRQLFATHWIDNQTPDIWDDASNWYGNVLPDERYDVTISPSASMLITGPAAPTTVRSFYIGGNVSSYLRFQDGASITATDGFTIGERGYLQGSGHVIADVLQQGGSIQIKFSGSTLAPAESFLIDGNYTMNGGSLSLSVAHPDSRIDQLVVTGDVALQGGRLAINGAEIKSPELGDQQVILSAQSITGHFSAVLRLLFANDLTLAVTYTDNSVLATVAIPGDTNLDQVINLADLQILGDHWGNQSATWIMGDYSGNGIVDLADLQILGDHWQQSAGDFALLAAQFIPEPTALSLLLPMLWLGSRRRSFCR